MPYIVYRTLNVITEDFYIGVHKLKGSGDSYLGSGRQLRKAIATYGEENFQRTTLFTFEHRSDAYEKERELVEPLLDDPKCMNLHPGGRGGFHYINRKGLGTKGVFGRAHQLHLFHSDPGYRTRWKVNYLKAMAIRPVYRPTTNGWEGKTHTLETRATMSKARKGTGTGSANSQYGTCWVTDTQGVSKKIPSAQLDAHLAQGYVRGRKL